jgi:myo-inositol-1(or 4)-monophosphatase
VTVSSQTIDLDLVNDWLKEAGEIALSQRKSLKFSVKTDNSLVTDIDRLIEAFLIDNINRSYPGHQTISEEEGVLAGKSEYTWAVDPIDGTRAFASGLPLWCISVGVFYRGVGLVGGIYLPDVKEMYLVSGESAFYNDQLLQKITKIDITNPMAFMAVPSNAHLLYDISFPRLRSVGSSIIHMLYVARGVATAALTRRIRIWDLAAVLPFLSSVGVYLSGKSFHINDMLGGEPSPEPIIVAPQKILEEVRMMIRLRPPN